jgi:hypothetical protein
VAEAIKAAASDTKVADMHWLSGQQIVNVDPFPVVGFWSVVSRVDYTDGRQSLAVKTLVGRMKNANDSALNVTKIGPERTKLLILRANIYRQIAAEIRLVTKLAQPKYNEIRHCFVDTSLRVVQPKKCTFCSFTTNREYSEYDHTHAHVLMPRMKGTLADLKATLPLPDRIRVLLKIFEYMRLLERQNPPMYYNDMKPENCLYDIVDEQTTDTVDVVDNDKKRQIVKVCIGDIGGLCPNVQATYRDPQRLEKIDCVPQVHCFVVGAMILFVLHKQSTFDFKNLDARPGESEQHQLLHEAAKYAIEWSRKDNVEQVAGMWEYVENKLGQVANSNKDAATAAAKKKF